MRTIGDLNSPSAEEPLKPRMRFFDAPPEDFHGKLPFPLTDIIGELRRRQSIDVEGIFRLNGSDTDIRRLCEELNNGRVDNWAKYEDIHTISCALKRYFRQMSQREPLLGPEIIPCLVAAMDLGTSNEQFVAQQKNLLKKIIRMLNLIRQLTLGYLVHYLHEVAENAAKNLMPASNLGICFGPNFIGDQYLDPETAVHDQQAINSAIAMMIDGYEQFFQGIAFPPALFVTDEDFSLFSGPPVNLIHAKNQILRCQSRKGRIIPFVPVCRLFKKFEPPAAEADAQADQFGSLLGLENTELSTEVRSGVKPRKSHRSHRPPEGHPNH
jgi:hypothetical protein